MKKTVRVPALFAVALGSFAAGCDGSAAQQEGSSRAVDYFHQGVNETPSLSLGTYAPVKAGLGVKSTAGSIGKEDLTVDYGLALRTASLKLRGDLPTLAEIRQLQAAVAAGATDNGASDPSKVYGDLVMSYINTTASFNRQMMQYWRNQFRMGDAISGLQGDSTTNFKGVNLETGPALAARLVADDKDMRLLFTQNSNACPTFNAATGTFTDGQCSAAGTAMVNGVSMATMGNNVPEGQQAGILTNPGFMGTYFSNFGFRRARVLQEIFACTRYPAEFAAMPKQIGTTLYASPWPEYSVSSSDKPANIPTWTARKVRGGGTTASKDYVDFALGRGCQGCHSTLNHRAPMFAGFDQVGYYNASQFMVPAPVTDSPWAQMQDYLPVGNQQLAWKFGKPAANFADFGKAMSEDAQVQRCFMIRAWNNAYSRDDVVQDLALVPDTVIKDLADYFVSPSGANYNFKKALYRLYTDANFIRF